MQWLWTWGGECFGYRIEEKLFTHFGKQAGRFDGTTVYGSDGKYLGELHQERLITHQSKRNYRGGSFAPVLSGAYAKYADYVGYVMLAGYEEFPSPESFR
jgi:hypothetical protein